jgi:hypothetical protein
LLVALKSGRDGYGRSIRYVAPATVLCDQPVATAIALIVVVLSTRIEPVYRVDDVVGVLPSVV